MQSKILQCFGNCIVAILSQMLVIQAQHNDTLPDQSNVLQKQSL